MSRIICNCCKESANPVGTNMYYKDEVINKVPGWKCLKCGHILPLVTESCSEILVYLWRNKELTLYKDYLDYTKRGLKLR